MTDSDAHLNVGAGALIEHDGTLLLLQRTYAPFAGQWNIPAGYVEVNESPERAGVREVREETGLEVSVVQLDDVYFYDDDPRGNGILIVYRCQIIGGALTETAEARNPAYFAPTDVPNELAGGGHDQAIRAWLMRMHS